MSGIDYLPHPGSRFHDHILNHQNLCRVHRQLVPVFARGVFNKKLSAKVNYWMEFCSWLVWQILKTRNTQTFKDYTRLILEFKKFFSIKVVKTLLSPPPHFSFPEENTFHHLPLCPLTTPPTPTTRKQPTQNSPTVVLSTLFKTNSHRVQHTPNMICSGPH